MKDCHAVVTGGGTGIGAAVAARLLSEGARVTLIGRRSEVLATTAKRLSAIGEVAGESADVTDAEALQSALDGARQRFGPVSALIANAGMAEAGPFHRLQQQQWDQLLAVNLTAVYLSIQAVLKDIREARAGRIVVVASTAGLKGYAYTAAYCAAKHGAVGLVRALALELAQTSVTVNALCPGFTDTDLAQEAIDRISSVTGRSREEAQAELIRFNPQGRLIEAEEVADAVAWLCTERAASLTGQAIAIAGGEI